MPPPCTKPLVRASNTGVTTLPPPDPTTRLTTPTRTLKLWQGLVLGAVALIAYTIISTVTGLHLPF